jgi:hypothetical protein
MISEVFKWQGKTPYRYSVDRSNGGEGCSHRCNLVRVLLQSGERGTSTTTSLQCKLNAEKYFFEVSTGEDL